MEEAVVSGPMFAAEKTVRHSILCTLLMYPCASLMLSASKIRRR
jgi:hypothetical protein